MKIRQDASNMRTFDVSPVKPCTARFQCASAESLLAKEGAFASACNVPALLTRVGGMHPFLGAVALSYAQHYPLMLAPDDVWLCLLQGLASHVENNAELLRGRFVRHEGKKTIRVEVDHEPGSDAQAWRGVIDALTQNVAEEIGKKRDLFVAGFSTTGPVEKTVFEVALLDTLQHYFSYEISVICGIPSMTLLGSPEDWRDLRTRAAVLAEFGLEAWTAVVLDILDRFVAASEGNVDVDFWRAMFKETRLGNGGNMVCGDDGTLVTGWVNVLLSTWCDASLETWMRHDRGTKLDSFASGLSKAPFVTRRFGQERAMELVAGFVGIAQDQTTCALRPGMGWFVREKPHAGSLRYFNQADPFDVRRAPRGPMMLEIPAVDEAKRSSPWISDSDAETHIDLAVAYFDMGMIRDGFQELEVVATGSRTYAGAALALTGEVLLAQGDRTGAAEAFRRALEASNTPERETAIRKALTELDASSEE